MRGYTVIPTTMIEIRREAKHRALASQLDHGSQEYKAAVEQYISTREAEAKEVLKSQEDPFPPTSVGTEDLAHYLKGLCDLLAPGHDDRIDARIGGTRLIAEAWENVIVAIAIPVSHPGNKSLSRRMRRIREKAAKASVSTMST